MHPTNQGRRVAPANFSSFPPDPGGVPGTICRTLDAPH
nr:MAG TPA: hypothetical protein [Caudoviricetes sp.]